MLKVITRYICIQFIPAFLVGFLFFVAFLNTFYMFRMLSLIINKGLDVWTVCVMTFNLSISFFPLAAPLAFFFATIFVLNRLSEDSEIIAMRSFGMTKWQLLTPFILIALPFSIALNSLYSVLIPKANADFKNTVVKLTSTGMLSSVKSGQFFTDIPKLTLFAKNVSEDGNGFENVFLHVNDKFKNEEQIIFAKSGTLIKIFADHWHAPNLRLHLYDGNIIHTKNKNAKIEKVLFKEYDFPVFSTDYVQTMLEKDSMKTNKELEEIISKKRIELKTVIKNSGSTKDEILDKKKNLFKTQNEYYSRFVTFTQIMLFVILAFSLGIKKGRSHTKNNTMLAVISLLGYFSLYFLLVGLAQKGKIDPAFANFAPSVFLLVVCIYFFKELDWSA
jgi:lipopolysaccharide export system permease protein